MAGLIMVFETKKDWTETQEVLDMFLYQGFRESGSAFKMSVPKARIRIKLEANVN